MYAGDYSIKLQWIQSSKFKSTQPFASKWAEYSAILLSVLSIFYVSKGGAIDTLQALTFEDHL